ncbi:MAG: TnpV protein [Clostridia bacterium]|nr:TnpV protein [Clostridia bacterium]
MKPKGAMIMELTYRQTGDYLLPDLKTPESPRIGKYGTLRRDYLRNQKKAIYTGMMISGKLNDHLEQIDREATEAVEKLTAQLAQKHGVTEPMKKTDQMKWIGMMNSLKASAEETVLAELIYS